MTERTQQLFGIGEKTVFPPHGVAVITALEQQEIYGQIAEFYVLRVLENDMTVRVPRQKAERSGMRRLIGAQEVAEVLATLQRRDVRVSTSTWNRRHREYTDKLNSASLHDIAEVFRDICLLRAGKELAFGERTMLDKARTRLVQELAMAQGRSEAEVGSEIERMFAPPDSEAATLPS